MTQLSIELLKLRSGTRLLILYIYMGEEDGLLSVMTSEVTTDAAHTDRD